MSENPYQSPMASGTAIGVLSGAVEDLRAVARYQKGILVCILVQILSGIFVVVLPQLGQAESLALVGLLVSIGSLIVGVFGTVFIFLLATKVYSTGIGILLGVLTLIPCLGLIVLLAVNAKATGILRQNGIKVGLLGANLSQI